jgi:hypothetical protein
MELPIASVLILGAIAGACQPAPLAHPSPSTSVRALFGPVIAAEVIRGREYDGDEVLLLVGATIVHVDLRSHRSSTTAIQLEPGESCWGLARLTDGSIWTLKGRNTAIQIAADGTVSRAIDLREPHMNLFGAGHRLVLQRGLATAPDPALHAIEPGVEGATPWSALKTRQVPGIARAQASALSLVACGGTDRAERPCWFPDQAALSLIDVDGRARYMALAGLAPISPEVLLTAENPRRPIRDAYVDRGGRIWVLSSGDPPAGAADLPGGWILARYSSSGAAEGQTRLLEPVRLILAVRDGRVIVLAGSGQVGEVTSW